MTKSDIAIEVRGDKEVQRKLEKFRKDTEPAKALKKAAIYVVSDLKQKGFRHAGGPAIWGQLTARHGGAGLQGSIRYMLLNRAGILEARVGSSGQSGIILKHWEGEGNTGPMKVVPKTKKFLHFFIGDDEIFTKQVWHEPTHMFEKAKKRTEPEVRRLLDDFIRDGKRKARL